MDLSNEIRPNKQSTIFFSVTSFIFGSLLGACIGQKPEYAAFTALMPMFWLLAPKRSAAWLTALSYYLAAARGVPCGASVFFGSTYPLEFSIFLYLGSSLALSLPWALLWPANQSNFSWRKSAFAVLRLAEVFLLLTIPPLGLFGWASPLLAAGWLFRGAGFWGLVLFLLLLVAAAEAVSALRRNRLGDVSLPGVALFIFLLWCCAVPSNGSSPVGQPDGWTVLNTHYGKVASGSSDVLDATVRSGDLFDKITAAHTPYILTPETVVGPWVRATQQYWEPLSDLLRDRGQCLFIGCEEYDHQGRYDNTLRALGISNVIYRQRFPVPFSMWRPFGGAGTAKAHWANTGVIVLPDGKRAGCLICYEQYLPLPVLVTAWQKPDFLIAVENHWWSRKTSLPLVARQSVISWAMLFDLPLVVATNL